MTRVPFETMCEVVTEAFVRAGMRPEDAQTCARVHTESSCDGVYSHGLNRVARFVDYLQRGWVDAHARPVIAKKLGAIEIYDGHRGPGILNAFFATDRAMSYRRGARRRHRHAARHHALDARRHVWLACGG